ncbi:hypothetical protein EDC35_101459 [Thiobaca trueperi]|uniref:Uncharacterized protein n=1 Tax=Thiobaca trueperi TaxID=127458 RepID=A0A4R3NAT8_9GAMM|nr:hypothetical protein EDC35_101459 [Thiobaca trueperi]
MEAAWLTPGAWTHLLEHCKRLYPSRPALSLSHFLFGGRQRTRGHYPETLVQAAIERTVDHTDARLRLLPGYRRRLREPVIQAIRHVGRLVDETPAPILVGRAEFAADPRLAALFVSANEMLERLAGETAGLHARAERRPARITALLLVERSEKHILGMDLVNGLVQREVAQIAVNFNGHRLLEPSASECKTRRHLKRRAFDHLLALARIRLAEIRAERADLLHQRDALSHRLTGRHATRLSEPAALRAGLDRIARELAIRGEGGSVLRAHLEIVAGLLGQAAQQLWVEDLSLHLDPMNIRRHPQDSGARLIRLRELHDARGRRIVPLLIAFRAGEWLSGENARPSAQRTCL